MTRRAAALLALLAAASPATAEKERAFTVAAAGRRVRVVVPKLFEPLLPGSVYPNRRGPREPRGAPVVVVERALAKRAEGPLLDRGFVVAEVDRVDRKVVEALLAELPRRLPVGPGTKVLARDCGDALLAPAIDAVAVFEPARIPEERPPAFHGVPVAVFRRTRDGAVPATDHREDACVVERWFRTDGDFPDDAFRDAAEWLAVTARPPD